MGYQRESVVVPHFDDYALASKALFQDNNARPHRMGAVMDLLQ